MLPQPLARRSEARTRPIAWRPRKANAAWMQFVGQHQANSLPPLRCPGGLVGIVAAAEIDLRYMLLVQQPLQHQRGQHRARRGSLERLVMRQFQHRRAVPLDDPKLCRGRRPIDMQHAEPKHPKRSQGAHQRRIEVREGLRFLPASSVHQFKVRNAGFQSIATRDEFEPVFAPELAADCLA